jgi:hypothetical protein
MRASPSPTPSQTAIPGAVQGKPKDLAGSLARHQRQSVWQIWVPFGFGAAVILGLAVLAAFAASQGSPELLRWTNVSLIFLIIPVAMSALIFVLLFGGMIYLMARLLHILPPYTQLGQAYAHYISVLVRVWSDRAANPFLAIRSAWAGFLTLWRRIFKH